MNLWRLIVNATLITCVGFAAEASAQNAASEIVVLKTPPVRELYYGPSPQYTTWRYFQTWSTDVARLANGRLIRVNHLDPRETFSSIDLWKAEESGRNGRSHVFQVKEAREIASSPPPPANWQRPEFDDGTWTRQIAPMGLAYSSISAICLRGKFDITDPAQVQQMNLAISYQGGVVVYMNGQEVARGHLPAGQLTPDTLAEDYPLDAYVSAQGNLMNPSSGCFHFLNVDPQEFARRNKDLDLQKRYELRTRKLAVKIPLRVLHKGMNVLAIEVRRAPAHEAMFARLSTKEMGYNLNDQRTFWWNRADIQEIKLTAQAEPEALVPSVGPPAGTYVTSMTTFERPSPNFAADLYEKPVIQLTGARNGKYSGQLIVSSSEVVKGVTARASELRTATGATIPASAVRIRYAQWFSRWYAGGYETLDNSPPAEVKPFRHDGAAVLPVWVTVDVPKTASAGDYTGKFTIAADGLEPTDVPLKLHVSGWTVPQPRDFAMYLGFIQSPDSLAIRYDVPMWSQQHWKLIEKSFELIGQLGNREVTIPLIRRTHFGNEHGMVRWVRQKDGSRKADLSIVERYLDVAHRHMGTITTVLFYISEAAENGTVPWITELDPATGALTDAKGPKWGTPESRAFWKPVFEDLRELLARRGLSQAMAVGLHAAGGNGPVAPKLCIEDLKEVARELPWARLGHYWFLGHDFLEKGPNGLPWARVALVGYFGVYWDPATDKPLYGWRNPATVVIYPRDSLREYAGLHEFRLLAETTLLSGSRRPRAGWGLADIIGTMGRDTCPGIRGLAPMGADFWPVLTADGKKYVRIIGRYNDPTAGIWDKRSSWSTTTIDGTVTWILGDGREGPVATTRFEALRESLQETEARVYLQNILTDAELKARLPSGLAGRCQELCDHRTRLLRRWSEHRVFKGGWFVRNMFDIPSWQRESRKLYDLAAEVAATLP